MARRNQNMRRLLEERERLASQIEALTHELAGLDRAIAVLQGEGGPPTSKSTAGGRQQRGEVKSTVLGLLQEYRENGLTAAEAVEIASARGTGLDRGSVSSLLSRLKRDGTLTYDGNKYRIADDAPPPAGGSDNTPDSSAKRFNLVR